MLHTNRQCTALHIAIITFSICQFTPMLSNQNAFTLQLSSMFSSFAEPLSTGLQNFKQKPSFAAAWSEYIKLPRSYQFGIGTAASLVTLAAGWKAGNSFCDWLDPVGAAQRAYASRDNGKLMKAIGRIKAGHNIVKASRDIDHIIDNCWTQRQLAEVVRTHSLTSIQLLKAFLPKTILKSMDAYDAIKEIIKKKDPRVKNMLLGTYIQNNEPSTENYVTDIKLLVKNLEIDPFAQFFFSSNFEELLQKSYFTDEPHITILCYAFDAFFANHEAAERTRLEQNSRYKQADNTWNRLRVPTLDETQNNLWLQSTDQDRSDLLTQITRIERTERHRRKLLEYAENEGFAGLLSAQETMRVNYYNLCNYYLTANEFATLSSLPDINFQGWFRQKLSAKKYNEAAQARALAKPIKDEGTPVSFLNCTVSPGEPSSPNPAASTSGGESAFEQFLKNDHIIDNIYNAFDELFAKDENKDAKKEKLKEHAGDQDFIGLLTANNKMLRNFSMLLWHYFTPEENTALNLPFKIYADSSSEEEEEEEEE